MRGGVNDYNVALNAMVITGPLPGIAGNPAPFVTAGTLLHQLMIRTAGSPWAGSRNDFDGIVETFIWDTDFLFEDVQQRSEVRRKDLRISSEPWHIFRQEALF
jgi:hypothetical protein